MLGMENCLAGKVVGGCPLEPGELPWLCAITVRGKFQVIFCLAGVF